MTTTLGIWVLIRVGAPFTKDDKKRDGGFEKAAV